MAVRVQAADFDVGTELDLLVAGRPEVGAAVTFTGYVRDVSGGRRLSAMTLEHYPGMAEAELERIEAEARSRWPLDDLLIIHRHGTLHPAERIVLVVALSAHREAAFAAAAFVMDFLKTRAPFWKKETGVAEDGEWVAAKASDDAAADTWDLPRAAE